MIGAEGVRTAYQLILGRDPESDEVVRNYQKCESAEELQTILLNSREFQSNTKDRCKPLDWPPMSVELDASPEHLAAMLHHIEAYWRDIDRPEAQWPVLQRQGALASDLTKDERDFYADGEAVVGILVKTAARCGIALRQYPRCLELGCGVGRLTVWLAELFPTLVGADISQTRLQLNRRALGKFNRRNVTHLHIDGLSALTGIAEFDFLFSLIVLQHNPPPVIVMLLKLLLEKLRPGGAAYFQVPTYISGYNFNSKRYLAEPQASVMEMHAIPQAALFDIIQQSGCRILELREDPWTESNEIISNTVFLTKSDKPANALRAPSPRPTPRRLT